MRGSLGRLTSSSGVCFTRAGRTIPSSGFSTLPGGGGGRGRGRGSSDPPAPQIGAATPGKADNDDGEINAFPSGLGYGRGKPIPSNPILPSFSSWMSGGNTSAGRGRAIQQREPSRQQEPSQQQEPTQHDPPSQESQSFQPKKPIFFRREDLSESTPKPQLRDLGHNPEQAVLPSSLLAGLPGAGRGKAINVPGNDERINQENRHLRPRPGGPPRRFNDESPQRSSPSPPRLNREDAVKNAVGILSRGGGGRGMIEEDERGRGFRGRGGRGRGGRGMRGMRGGRRGGRGGRGESRDSEDGYGLGLYLGDNADGERLAKEIGAENMDKLVEGFEQISSEVLPSPMDDAYLDALHTNNLIEYEPEYLMGDFGTNPDIDDTPPIPLRDALEKMKPFLMAYEGIKDQQEWEEIMKETMEKVPAMKELIEIYCGPDRVTAMQQQKELERVAATVPDKVPSSVKRSVNRAVLSLQSNPGWGFDKKCQFMDKLVWEVSQQYK